MIKKEPEQPGVSEVNESLVRYAVSVLDRAREELVDPAEVSNAIAAARLFLSGL